MNKLVDKISQLFHTIESGDGSAVVELNILTGAIRINDIEFSIEEQKELAAEFKENPTFSNILGQLGRIPNSEKAKEAFFTPEYPKMVFTKADSLAAQPYLVSSLAKCREDEFNEILYGEKEHAEYISKLEEENKRLRAENERLTRPTMNVRESMLTLNHFNIAELHPFVEEISEETVQDIIDELKGVEVPQGAFLMHRTGNVGVLKLHDDQGVSYIIMEDYLFANVD